MKFNISIIILVIIIALLIVFLVSMGFTQFDLVFFELFKLSAKM